MRIKIPASEVYKEEKKRAYEERAVRLGRAIIAVFLICCTCVVALVVLAIWLVDRLKDSGWW